jgi:hypothetical protein
LNRAILHSASPLIRRGAGDGNRTHVAIWKATAPPCAGPLPATATAAGSPRIALKHSKPLPFVEPEPVVELQVDPCGEHDRWRHGTTHQRHLRSRALIRRAPAPAAGCRGAGRWPTKRPGLLLRQSSQCWAIRPSWPTVKTSTPSSSLGCERGRCPSQDQPRRKPEASRPSAHAEGSRGRPCRSR